MSPENMHHARERTRGLAATALLVFCSACATTNLNSTWIKPELASLRINSVVAMAISKNPARRRAMEASMVEQIRDKAPEVTATESSTLIDDDDLRNESRVREHLDGAGFDAQLVMRVTDVNRHDVYVPGRTTFVPSYYRTFWGYYRYWVPIAYEPGYIEHERDVRVETELYLADAGGELVYSAVSQTFNPNSPADLAKEVTGAVAKDLKEKGLLG
jgi:hypothetical protein